MPAPTDLVCLFVYTIPEGLEATRFDLYIDNATKPVASSNAPINPWFRVQLAIGPHTYEIKCVNRQLVKGQDKTFTSRAAGGSFRVDPEHREFLVGTTNNYFADAIIQYLLDFANWADGVADYTLTVDAIIAQGSWVIDQITNQGAPPSSANYDPATGGYKQVSGSGSTFSDVYPLGAQVHAEIRDGVGGLDVIDFVVGQPDTPNPTTVEFESGFPVLNSIVFNSTGSEIGTPTSPGVACVSAYTGDYAPDLTNLYFLFDYGNTNALLTVPADNTGAPFNFTSGPIFDYISGLTGNQFYNYLVLDSTQKVVIGSGSVQFTSQ